MYILKSLDVILTYFYCIDLWHFSTQCSLKHWVVLEMLSGHLVLSTSAHQSISLAWGMAVLHYSSSEQLAGTDRYMLLSFLIQHSWNSNMHSLRVIPRSMLLFSPTAGGSWKRHWTALLKNKLFFCSFCYHWKDFLESHCCNG